MGHSPQGPSEPGRVGCSGHSHSSGPTHTRWVPEVLRPSGFHQGPASPPHSRQYPALLTAWLELRVEPCPHCLPVLPRLGVPWPLWLLPGHPMALHTPCPTSSPGPSQGGLAGPPDPSHPHPTEACCRGPRWGSWLPPPPALSPPKPLLPRSTRAPTWSPRPLSSCPAQGWCTGEGESVTK